MGEEADLVPASTIMPVPSLMILPTTAIPFRSSARVLTMGEDSEVGEGGSRRVARGGSTGNSAKGGSLINNLRVEGARGGIDVLRCSGEIGDPCHPIADREGLRRTMQEIADRGRWRRVAAK